MCFKWKELRLNWTVSHYFRTGDSEGMAFSHLSDEFRKCQKIWQDQWKPIKWINHGAPPTKRFVDKHPFAISIKCQLWGSFFVYFLPFSFVALNWSIEWINGGNQWNESRGTWWRKAVKADYDSLSGWFISVISAIEPVADSGGRWRPPRLINRADW